MRRPFTLGKRTDHACRHRMVRGFVHQDERAGGRIVAIRVADDRLLQTDIDGANVIQRDLLADETAL